MAAIPTLEEEDARRPNREREVLVAERTRVINRIRGCLARLGIRGFKPTLRRAPERLEGLRGREKGLAKAGNARLRRGMIQLAWRFLGFQRRGALAQRYRARTADARPGTRKTLIVALARKLLLALWRFATTGQPPAGVALGPGMETAGEEGKNKIGGCRRGAGADKGPRGRLSAEKYGFDAGCGTG